MFKKYALAALAIVSASALAQTNDDWAWQDPASMDHWGQRDVLMKAAHRTLSGGDVYILSNILDRSPSHVTMALANSLSKNHYQARMIGAEIRMAQVPASQTSYTTTVTNPDGTVTTTTTTTTTSGVMWADNARPMRMVMERSGPRMISYDEALDILTANLGEAESTVIREWWRHQATERQMDVIVRFLKGNAMYADFAPRSWAGRQTS